MQPPYLSERRRKDDLQTPWDVIVYYIKQLMAAVGMVALVGVLGISAGYWWAKSGEKYFMQSVKADTARVDCGSCKKGTNK